MSALTANSVLATLVASATDVFDRLKRRSGPLAQDPDDETLKGFAFQHRTDPFRVERREPRLRGIPGKSERSCQT
jgi:hypothetical protein